MAEYASGPAAGAAGERGEEVATHGEGWLLFAGIMLLFVGIMNFIYGIAAIDESQFYVREVEYILADLKTWGWILLIVGVIQIAVAFAIWNGSEWGRWAGVGFAGANGIVQLLFIPAFPLAALAIFAVDLLIIYGLVVHGGRSRRMA